MNKVIKYLALGALGVVIGGTTYIVGEHVGVNEKPAIVSPAPGDSTSADVEELQTKLDEFKAKLATAEATLKQKEEALQEAEANTSIDKETIATLRQDKENSLIEINNLQNQIKNLELQIETELMIDLTQLMPYANEVYRQKLDTGILFSPDTSNGGIWFYSYNTKQLNKVYDCAQAMDHFTVTPGGCFMFINKMSIKYALVFKEDTQTVVKLDLVPTNRFGGYQSALVLDQGIVLTGTSMTNYVDFETLSDTVIAEIEAYGVGTKMLLRTNEGCIISGATTREGTLYFDEATKVTTTITNEMQFTKGIALNQGCLLFADSDSTGNTNLTYYFKYVDKTLTKVSENFNVKFFKKTDVGCLFGGSTNSTIKLFNEDTLETEDLVVTTDSGVTIADMFTLGGKRIVEVNTNQSGQPKKLYTFVESEKNFVFMDSISRKDISNWMDVGEYLFLDIKGSDSHSFKVLSNSGNYMSNKVPDSKAPYEFRKVDDGVLIIGDEIAYLFNTSNNSYSLYGYVSK